jgi:GNAT superfamily N-acetyltransferase
MYTIRPAVDGDAQIISSFDHIAQQDAGRRDFIQQAIDEGACFVAGDGDQIVGYAKFEHSFFGNGFVVLLYIHPEHRRRGAGAALMRHFASICRTPKLFTSTNLSNLPMQSLLAREGYTLTGVVDNLDEGDPELIYFKRVAPAAPPALPDSVAAMWDAWRDQMNATIDARPSMSVDERQDMREQVAKIQVEASRGAQADPGRLEKLINTLAVYGPDIFEVAVATLENPLKGIGLALRKISDRARVERAAGA